MAKYLLAYHGGRPQSDEEGARVMAAWEKWMGGIGAAMVDGGQPVGVSATVNSDGSHSPGGGGNPVTGYSIITADSLDSAVATASSCPILEAGGTVEVGELFDVM